MFGRHRNTRPETVIRAMQEACAEREADEPPRPRVTEHGYILPRVYDQSERDHSAYSPEAKRDRRRRGLPTVYGPDFVLSHEVAAVLSDLPARIMSDRRPVRWTVPVADAVTPITRALAEIARALRAPAPALPDRLSAESVADGSWAVAVLDAARAR